MALCLQGSCEKGRSYVIPEDVILGEVKTEVTGEYEGLVGEAVSIQEEMFRETKPLNDDADQGSSSSASTSTDGSSDGSTTSVG